MILDLEDGGPGARSLAEKAGAKAERQMAFYLERAFGKAEDVFVINGARIRGPEEIDDHIAQIDHLVVHRFGFFLIESKASRRGLRVEDDAGGDQWSYEDARGHRVGVASPVRQAERQASVLRDRLGKAAPALLRPFGGPIGLLARVVNGSTQRAYRCAPMQILVAISDTTYLERPTGWQPDHDTFRSAVLKADLVTDFIHREIDRHRRGVRIPSDGDYGVWRKSAKETESVARFLQQAHEPRRGVQRRRHAPRVTPAYRAVCKSCDATNLDPAHGRYGYFFVCGDCRTNTSMPRACLRCDSRDARVRKQRENYFQDCPHCSSSVRLWPACDSPGR